MKHDPAAPGYGWRWPEHNRLDLRMIPRPLATEDNDESEKLCHE